MKQSLLPNSMGQSWLHTTKTTGVAIWLPNKDSMYSGHLDSRLAISFVDIHWVIRAQTGHMLDWADSIMKAYQAAVYGLMGAKEKVWMVWEQLSCLIRIFN